MAAFDALPKKIDSIKDYQAGKNVSPIGFDDGFTHCFLVTFKDEAGRAKYLPHPDHKAFGDTLRPHLDKVFVVDYWGKPEKARKERELKHALFLKFKDSATGEQVKDVEEALAKLPSQCDSIKAFEWGKNNSPEKHDEGFTHCYMFTFDDAKGLKAYAASAGAQSGRRKDSWPSRRRDACWTSGRRRSRAVRVSSERDGSCWRSDSSHELNAELDLAVVPSCFRSMGIPVRPRSLNGSRCLLSKPLSSGKSLLRSPTSH